MNARKMSKTKKPAKTEAPAKHAQANKSVKRGAASAEFGDEDEPGTSKRPKPGATSPGARKAASAEKAKAAKTSGKAKHDSAKGSGKASTTSSSGGKKKAASSSGKATSPGNTKAAPSARSTKAASSTSAGKAKAASKAKGTSTGKSAAGVKSAGEAKAGKGAAGKAAEAKGAGGSAKRKGRAAEDEFETREVELDADEADEEDREATNLDGADEEDREAAAGTITEEDDWIDAAEDEADSAERGEPLTSDISEIRSPRERGDGGATGAELAEGGVQLGEDEISADSQPAPTTRAHLKRVVESLIFVADQPVNANQLGRLVKAKAAEVREVVTEIMRDYDGRGIELVEVSGGFQFRSAAASAPFVRDLVSARPVRLTRAQLETLALIAYRQPITRPEIDDVRGVDSGSAIKVLLDRDLVKILGRKDEAGRPLLYGTAPQFLDFFGMNTLQDLPTLREFTELSEENRELFAKKMGEVPEDLSDPAFEPVVQRQEYDDDGNPITPVPEPAEGVEPETETAAGEGAEEGDAISQDSELDASDEAVDGEASDQARVDSDDSVENDSVENDSVDDEDVEDESDEDDDEDEDADEGEAVDQADVESDESDEDDSDEDEDVEDEDEDEDVEEEDADEGEAVDQVDVDSDESDEDESDEDEDESDDEGAGGTDEGEAVDHADDESDADDDESDDDESDDDESADEDQ